MSQYASCTKSKKVFGGATKQSRLGFFCHGRTEITYSFSFDIPIQSIALQTHSSDIDIYIDISTDLLISAMVATEEDGTLPIVADSFQAKITNGKTKRRWEEELSNRHADLLLLLCCLVSGLVDSTIYNAYGTFVSMQTGLPFSFPRSKTKFEKKKNYNNLAV